MSAPIANFATPIRTKNCEFLPRTLATAMDALAAIQALPPETRTSKRWDGIVKLLTYALKTDPSDAELANTAASELRAALLAMGWLD